MFFLHKNAKLCLLRKEGYIMLDNNLALVERKPLSINEIWSSQHPLMHSWLLISFVGLVLLYFAMSFSIV